MTRKKTTLKDVGIELKDLERLENYLICVPHCKKHKRQSVLLDLEGRTKEAELLEDSWKSCKKCNAIREEWLYGAWGVQGTLFRLAPGSSTGHQQTSD